MTMKDYYKMSIGDGIATTDMLVIDELFGNLETPEDVNKFIEEEYTED